MLLCFAVACVKFFGEQVTDSLVCSEEQLCCRVEVQTDDSYNAKW